MAVSNPSRFERLGVLYALALSGIAITMIVSQVYLQDYISQQKNNSHIINLAGRQRMLSQKISKVALQLGTTSEPAQRKVYANELADAIDLWTTSHQTLLSNGEVLGITNPERSVIDTLYQTLNPSYTAIVTSAQQLLTQLRQSPSASLNLLQPHIDSILQNEPAFLEVMDNIVFQYDDEAQSRILYLKNIELVLLAVALTMILFELLFIFRPTARRIRDTMRELMESKEQAQGMTHELGVLYESLENSYQALAEVQTEELPPTVYATTDRQGNFHSVAEAFTNALEYEVPRAVSNLFDWLEQQGYGTEQVRNIQRTVSEGKPWRGEVKAVSDSGDFIWLDTHLVPVLDEQQRVSTLQMICTNQTERKEAKVRSHEITRERIEKKLKEQQYRSILILEGQEEERSRISRDIHDGIGQLLTALKYKIEGINLAPGVPEREAKVEETKEILGQVIREVRRVSFNLNPSALSDYGIVPVTKRFCSEASRLSDRRVTFENTTGFINRLDKNVETNLYRIVQEAVNNAIKYANANVIRVIFSHNAHYLNVDVLDDGVGFNEQQYENRENIQGSGLGIFNMRERASFINATFEIQSAEGKGTQINVHVPINGQTHGNY